MQRILFALALFVVAPAVHAGVAGRLDFANGTVALGWACIEGEANRTLVVRLEAREVTGTSWDFAGTASADAERLDVAAWGVCGSASPNRHGFEHTVWPQWMLASGREYDVRAVALVDGNAIALPGVSRVGFPESGFPASATWRTDFDDPQRRDVTMASCVFPFKGANANGNFESDPLLMSAGSTVTVPWVRHPELGETAADFCIANEPGPFREWSSANSATNAASWPMSNYWVVSANSERAWSRTQSGPPGQSEPINAGGVYGVAADDASFTLSIDNRPPYTDDDFPFLSIGSEIGRGTPGVLARIEPHEPDHVLAFDITPMRRTDAIDPYGRPHYHDVHVFVEAMWGGYKRLVYLSFGTHTVGVRRWWNWNALESFWFPGGEINFFGYGEALACGGFETAQIPPVAAIADGATVPVRLPLRALFECVESRGPAFGWNAPRDSGLALVITGVHLGIEQADYQAGSAMTVRFSRPTIEGSSALFANGFE